MPLIILSGIPCSGKTTRAIQIKEYFEKLGKNVVLVNEESLHIVRAEGYRDSTNEKLTRGKIKSETERSIGSLSNIIICDSLNYIKGFRYELFCSSKAARCSHCVLFCDTDPSLARQWNSSRQSDSFSSSLFDELVMRFEKPIGTNRWDSPLFTVSHEHPTPLQSIHDHFYSPSSSAPKPNMSTLPQRLAPADFLYELDRITTEIIQSVMQQTSAGTCMPGDEIVVHPKTLKKVRVPMKMPTWPLVRQMKQAYTRLMQMRPPSSEDVIASSFVDHLNSSL